MSLDLTEALQGTTHTDGKNALTLKNTNFKRESKKSESNHMHSVEVAVIQKE